MYKNTHVVLFFILCSFTFPPINALVYVHIDQDIHKGKGKISLELFVERTSCSFSLKEKHKRKGFAFIRCFKMEYFLVEICSIKALVS